MKLLKSWQKCRFISIYFFSSQYIVFPSHNQTVLLKYIGSMNNINVMLSCINVYDTFLYQLIWYFLILIDMILSYINWYDTFLYELIWYFLILIDMILSSINWYDTFLYELIWYFLILIDMILSYINWYDTFLY